MSYDTNCIEIRPDGDVIAGGNLVGKIEFAGGYGILGRLYGVGVHTLQGEGFAPDLDDEWDQDNRREILKARSAIRRAAGLLAKADPDIKAAIKLLTGALK